MRGRVGDRYVVCFRLKEVLAVISSQRHSPEALSKRFLTEVLGRCTLFSLEETRLKKKLSKHRPNNKINKAVINKTNKYFH